MASKKVVVIGAGCAGLSAAYNLRKQGVEVVLFEASGVVGGRCRTEYEQGYEFYVGAGSTEPQWATTFQYLEELGLRDRVYSIQKQRYGFVRNGKIRTIFMGGSFWEMVKALPENLRFIFSGIPWKTYPQVIKVFSALSKYMKLVDTKNHNFDALAEISNMSTEEFVLKYGGPEALEYIFHPFLALMVLARPRDISIAHPISLFSLMKGMRSIEGGIGVITAGLYEKVKDSVVLNTPVKKVVIKDNKVVGVETSEGFVEADQVICAVDAVLARQLIPDLPEAMRKPLETCEYSSTYNYQFGLEKPLVDASQTPFYVIAIPASENTILDMASLGNPSVEKPVAIMMTRGWEDEKLAKLSPEERRRLVIQEVQKLHPAFPDEPVVTKVFRWDRAVNTEAPGQFVAIRDLLKNHMQDVSGLYLAGEYLFLIACTEGAFATGKKAAEQAVEDLLQERL
jgi:protoporphyrinogen/coproporphyrinogen III oxidase